MLFIAVIFSVYSGAITLKSVITNLILLPAMIILWSFSYYAARNPE